MDAQHLYQKPLPFNDWMPTLYNHDVIVLFPSQTAAFEPADPDLWGGDFQHWDPPSTQHDQVRLPQVRIYLGAFLSKAGPGG